MKHKGEIPYLSTGFFGLFRIFFEAPLSPSLYKRAFLDKPLFPCPAA
jgi:hypothetical protein